MIEIMGKGEDIMGLPLIFWLLDLLHSHVIEPTLIGPFFLLFRSLYSHVKLRPLFSLAPSYETNDYSFSSYVNF